MSSARMSLLGPDSARKYDLAVQEVGVEFDGAARGHFHFLLVNSRIRLASSGVEKRPN